MASNNPASNNFNDEKQVVKTSAWLSLLALTLALAFIILPILSGSSEQSAEKSIIKAQSVGYQAATIEQRKSLENEKDSTSASATLGQRGPASISDDVASGTLGQDPWGQPFHYKIRLEGNQKVVDVWSEGENGVRTQVLIPLNTHQSVQVPF